MLGTLAVALVAAFVVAPRHLASSRSSGSLDSEHKVVRSVREAFVEYWSSGDRDFSPRLTRVVDYWFRYHVAKAVIAAVLLVVLVALGVLLWQAFLRADGRGARRRAVLASTGSLVAMLTLVSMALVMANVQGAVAPFASLLPMLMDGPADGELADALDQVRQGLAESPPAQGRTLPPLDVMVSDFSRYHLVMVVIAATVAVLLIAASLVLRKGFTRTTPSDRRTRRVFATFSVLAALFSLAAIVLVVANATTVADPAPALLALFEGGW